MTAIHPVVRQGVARGRCYDLCVWQAKNVLKGCRFFKDRQIVGRISVCPTHGTLTLCLMVLVVEGGMPTNSSFSPRAKSLALKAHAPT